MLNKVSNSTLTDALVVKLVDTKDLKSLPSWECQFESGRGHHEMKKLYTNKNENKFFN